MFLQKKRQLLFIIPVIFLFLASCTATKKVIYLNDLTAADSAALRQAQNVFETPIQKNDQLWITVGGSNPADLPALNSGTGLISGGAAALNSGGLNVVVGYFVEADGTVKIPYLGKVHAEGLTRLQLEKNLTEMFKDYTKNPVVNVRFLNYNFSVIGEVNRPGRYSMPTERTTILEAVSMAGDITYLGKSDNVTIIREQNGVRTIAKINLLSKEVFKSPFYYIKTNDLIYVEPVKAKFISRAGVPQYVSLIAVGLSLILTIVNITK